MTDHEQARTLCGECGTAIDETTESSPTERSPCPKCGSINRRFQITITSTISVTSGVTATLNKPERGVPQFVSPETIRSSVTVPQPTIRVEGDPGVNIEDLPTEVIGDSLQLLTTLLPPDIDDPDGQWVADVGLPGVQVPLGVGELDDILIAAAEWFSGLAARSQEKRRGESP